MIPVLLVDDSPIALMVLKKMIANSPDIEVVGTASNGREGLAMIPRVRPKVICTDLHMPQMDGFEFTRAVMAQHPLPILVVSVSVQESADDHNIFELLEAGAIDVFPKPRGGLGSNSVALSQELINKIKLLSGVVPIRRRQRNHQRTGGLPAIVEPSPRPPGGRRPRLISIGSSTGGPQALLEIFSNLPAGFPIPILCIQHISEGFLQEMVNWLDGHTPLSVRIAEIGLRPVPGHIYFPPEGSHLVINGQGRFARDEGHPEEAHRPSIDIAFRSVAAYYRQEVVGVLLTGMGRDGAEGLRTIADQGGLTIAQDEATCVVFGMPAQAIKLGGVRKILPITRIAPTLRGVAPATMTNHSLVIG